MKGVHWKIIIGLVIAVIVMAIALYFLVFVENFDSLFLSNDQRILKQYATCALAYCATGGKIEGDVFSPTPQIQKVGCLKSEGGKCTLSCEQVYDKYFRLSSGETDEYFGNYLFCGKEFSIPFEFSGLSLGGTVPFKSGQMDKLAKSPEWICKPLKFPFTDFYIDEAIKNFPFGGLPPHFDTVSFQHYQSDRNCIMKGGLHPDQLGVLSIPHLILDDITKAFGQVQEGYTRGGGCFENLYYIEDDPGSLYTPIYEYDISSKITGEQGDRLERNIKTHSSAIYLNRDDKFTEALDGASDAECRYMFSGTDYAAITEDSIKKVAEKYWGSTVVEIDDPKCTPSEDKKCDKISVTLGELDSEISVFSDSINDPKCFDKLRAREADPEADVSGCGGLVPFGELHPDDQGKIALILLGKEFGPPKTPEDENLGRVIESCRFRTTMDGKKIPYKVWSDHTFPRLAFAFSTCKSVTLSRDLTNLIDITDSDIDEALSALSFTDPAPLVQGPDSQTDAESIGSGGISIYYDQNTDSPFGAASDARVRKSVFDGESLSSGEEVAGKDKGDGRSSESSAAFFSGETYVAYTESFQSNEIIVKGPSGKMRLTDDDKDQGAPAIVSYGGKLYVFYYEVSGEDSHIVYSVGEMKDGKVVWTKENNKISQLTGMASDPDAMAVSDGILIAYSYSDSGSGSDIMSVKFDGTTKDFSLDNQKVTDDPSVQGWPSLVSYNGVYVFYDAETGETDLSREPPVVSTKISYKKYIGPEWEADSHDMGLAGKGMVVQPEAFTQFSDLYVAFSSYEGEANEWDIMYVKTKASTEPTVEPPATDTPPADDTPPSDESTPPSTPPLPPKPPVDNSDPASKTDFRMDDVSYDSALSSLSVKFSYFGESAIDSKSVIISVNQVKSGSKTGGILFSSSKYLTGGASSIKNSESRTVKIPISDFAESSGTVSFAATIDPNFQVKEFNENNNLKTNTVSLNLKESSCLSLDGKADDPSMKKARVVFIASEYKDIGSFVDHAKIAVAAISAREPFKSNMDKFRFYYINNPNADVLVSNPTSSGFNVDYAKPDQYASFCKNGAPFKIVLTKSGFDGYARLSQYLAVASTEDFSSADKSQGEQSFTGGFAFTILHEFGHSFGGLDDEYVQPPEQRIVSDTSLGYQRWSSKAPVLTSLPTEGWGAAGSPNCDIKACPDWCSGTASPDFAKYESACRGISSESACKSYSGADFSCWWALDEKTSKKVCAIDPRSLPRKSFGQSCQAGTGCFLGCAANGANLWRSSFTSIMGRYGSDSSGTESTSFNPLSVKHMGSVLGMFK